jgi:hypothetical protein
MRFSSHSQRRQTMASPIQNNQSAFDQVGWSIQTFFGIALLINSITIAILAFSDGGAAVNVPVTVMVVFINVMAMIGLNSNIDDASAVLADLSEEEKKLHRYQNWIKAPFIMYRALIILGFGGSMLAQLWSMYLA